MDAHNREKHLGQAGRIGRLIDELRQAVRRLDRRRRDRLAAWITSTTEADDASEQQAKTD